MKISRTFDIHFNSDTDSLSKGFKESKKYCIEYVHRNLGLLQKENKGYTVTVVCNETGNSHILINL